MIFRPVGGAKTSSPKYSCTTVFLSLILILFFAGSLFSDEKTASFERFSANDGLSLNSIMVLMQDSRGFIWIGTEDGLDKYDGRKFTNFTTDPDDPESMRDSYIRSLAEDKDGWIWLLTSEGVDIYNPEAHTFGHARKYSELNEMLDEIELSRIFVDRSGDIWFGTYSQGAIRFNKNTQEIKRYLDKGQVFDRSVLCFFEDKDGIIFFGGFNGVKKLDPVSHKIMDALDDEAIAKAKNLEYIYDVVVDKYRNIWMASYTQGLFRYSLLTLEMDRFVPDSNNSSSLPSFAVTSLALDKNGDLWVGTEDMGLARFDYGKHGFDRYHKDNFDSNSLAANSVADILSDRSGVLWVGTRGGGLNKMLEASKVFKHYNITQDARNTMSSNDIFALVEDENQIIWFGTSDGGLNSLDRKTNRYAQHPINWSKGEANLIKSVMALCLDSKGRLWVGTVGYGLWTYDRKTGKAVCYHISKKQDGIAAVSINDIFEDSFGDIWVASASWGLFRLKADTGQWVHYKRDKDNQNTLSSYTVYHIYEDSKHRIWLGMYKGVNRIDRDTGVVTRYSVENSDGVILPEKDVTGIIEDDAGDLWFGSWGSGIIRVDFENKKVSYIRKKEGLANDSIYGFLKDDKGNLWASTNKGIASINPVNLKITNYSIKDGLQSDEFNAGAYFRTVKGEMLFGGVNGFNAFYPHKVVRRKKNAVAPPIAITGLKVFNREILPGKEYEDIKIIGRQLENSRIELNYDKNFLTFEFVALDYHQPSKNRYAYKLTPLNEDWIQLENRNHVDLTLNPGEYTMTVRGSNNDGVWNEEGASLKIIVIPPFWKTLWFQAIIVFLLASLIAGYVYLHIRSIRIQRDLLKSEVEKATRDLNDKNVQLEKQTDDLAHRKRLLEESNEELTIRNKEMESFCYTVSHDLRAPLRHISGYNDIILDMYSEGLDEEAREFMKRINLSANRMNEMIESFLWLSRANRQEMNVVDLDLSNLAKEIVNEFRTFEPEREVEVSIEDGLLCRGDARLIRVLLENLLSNAWKYTRKEEKPSIRFFETEYRGRKMFCVQDNGAGFKQENASRLFHAFERMHNDKVFEGMGIGLSTVDKIIKRHHGRVYAEGSPGEGASFYFYINPDSSESLA